MHLWTDSMDVAQYLRDLATHIDDGLLRPCGAVVVMGSKDGLVFSSAVRGPYIAITLGLLDEQAHATPV